MGIPDWAGALRARADCLVNAMWQESISNKLNGARSLFRGFNDPFSAGKLGVADFGSAGNYVVRIAGRFDCSINAQPVHVRWTWLHARTIARTSPLETAISFQTVLVSRCGVVR